MMTDWIASESKQELTDRIVNTLATDEGFRSRMVDAYKFFAHEPSRREAYWQQIRLWFLHRNAWGINRHDYYVDDIEAAVAHYSS